MKSFAPSKTNIVLHSYSNSHINKQSLQVKLFNEKRIRIDYRYSKAHKVEK